MDLPWAGVAQVVEAAFEHCGRDEVVHILASGLRVGTERLAVAPQAWPGADVTELALRQAIGRSAKTRGWFKRVDLGEALTRVVVDHLPAIPDTDLARKVAALKDWTRADA